MSSISIPRLKEMKRAGEKIACLTAYDATFAGVLDAAGVEVLLVGDSLGMVIQGSETTLEVSLRDTIYHASSVRRRARRSLVVADLPFMSYTKPFQALGNAARLVSEGGAQVVKLEGGAWLAETVSLLDSRGIPVCSHLGLMPQSIHKLGGYRVQGREKEDAERIFNDAKTLEDAGAAMLVLECVPGSLATDIAQAVSMPVIGIGAGAGCDGQVLVVYDMLGLTDRLPKFCQNFLASTDGIQSAIRAYVAAVKSGDFPGREHGFD